MGKDERPRLGACALVLDGDRVVLGRRARGANKGKWVLPGGGVEFGEKVVDAVIREFKEETGLDIEVLGGTNPRPYYVMEIMGRTSHRVCLVLGARLLRPLDMATPTEEISEVRAFSCLELDSMADLSPHVEMCLQHHNFMSPKMVPRCIGCQRTKGQLIADGHEPDCKFDFDGRNLSQ